MKTQVLIVGGGFGGLNVAKALAKDSNVQVTLIDRRNHHLFQPLLYQVATAGLSPADIATPIRALFSNRSNVTVLLDEALEIYPDENRVVCKTETITYDYLILACGAAHSYFGHNEWEEFAPGLKTIEQATEIRRRVLTAFEEAEKEPDPAKKEAWLTFSIVGGGPTGVELAGAVAELSKRTVRNEFSHINPADSKIYLIEAGPRALAQFAESLSKDATKDLEQLGVVVKTSTRVTLVDANEVKTETGTPVITTVIPCKTTIWAAGVAPSALGKKFKGSKPVDLDKAGRVSVTENLNLAHYSNVYVIGDQASFINKDGKPLPGLAPVAMQQGRHAAKNVALAIAKQPLRPFHYLDKGSLATIGRKKAVLQFGKIKMSGFLAWVAWLFIHIFYLIGFKNRLFVFWQWTWNYLTYSRGARLIVDKDWHLKP